MFLVFFVFFCFLSSTFNFVRVLSRILSGLMIYIKEETHGGSSYHRCDGYDVQRSFRVDVRRIVTPIRCTGTISHVDFMRSKSIVALPVIVLRIL